MWLLFWKKYQCSKFATFISIIGALTRYAAVLCLTYSEIVAMLICAAIGIALHFLAELINNKKWQKTIVKNGYATKIANGDLETAIAVYNTNPCESTLKFIAMHSAQMADAVRARINN